jgi:2-phosphoglycerate kinase
LLLGGTSNAGKSATAAAIARRIGAAVVSTDSLGRHPGRPWPQAGQPVKPHVAAHYTMLPPQQLLRAVTVHYRNLWPRAHGVIDAHLATAQALVLEGSEVLPESVATLQSSAIYAVWLGADDDLLRARILSESRYEQLDRAGRSLVDAFIARTLLFNAFVSDDARARGFVVAHVHIGMSADDMAADCLACARPVTPRG